MDARAILETVLRDPRYIVNLDWGKPRRGHPEGTCQGHIVELEGNIERLRSKLTDQDCWKLRLLIHTHDSFKAESEHGVPIAHPMSHASLARAFLAERCDDADLLAMVQYHDEPYALYLQVEREGRCNQARFEELLKTIRDWNLFLAFSIVDNCTAGKSRDPLHWLFQAVDGRVESRFTEADIPH